MSNPYQPPTEETRERSARPWMILSAVLFAGVILLGFSLWQSMLLRQFAQEREQLARQKAVVLQQTASEALKEAEAVRERDAA